MNKNHSIKLKFSDESILISQSDFWYFKKLLNNISYYFKLNQNKNKNILIKVPGSGKYKCINIYSFNNIKEQMERHLTKYKQDYKFFSKLIP